MSDASKLAAKSVNRGCMLAWLGLIVVLAVVSFLAALLVTGPGNAALVGAVAAGTCLALWLVLRLLLFGLSLLMLVMEGAITSMQEKTGE